MDALKLIEKDSTKAELPKFNIGDTVKVSVNIREGQREIIQRHLPFVVFHTVLVLREYSQCIHQM